MIIRSAILEGEVATVDRAQFDRHMTETVVAAIGTYPRIKGVTLRRTLERDVFASVAVPRRRTR